MIKLRSENDHYNSFLKEKGQSSRWQCLGKHLFKLSSEFVIGLKLRDCSNHPPLVPVGLCEKSCNDICILSLGRNAIF